MDIEASLRKEERVDFSFWALVIVEKKKKSSVSIGINDQNPSQGLLAHHATFIVPMLTNLA